MRYSINNKKIKKCSNFKCDMLLANRKFLVSQLYKTIKRITIFFKIRDIDDRKHNTSKYCELDFYILKTLSNKTFAITYFKREMHVIDNLRIKIFIDINILRLKVIVFDVTQKKIVIDSCNIIASLFVILRKKRVERKLRNRK